MRGGRVATLAVAALVSGSLLLSVMPAGAQSVGDARQRLRDMRASFQHATGVYLNARSRWEGTQSRLAETNATLRRTRAKLMRRQGLLNMRIAHLYRTPSWGVVEVLLGSSDFTDVISGMDFLARIGFADAKLVLELKQLKQQMGRQRVALKSIAAGQAKITTELQSKAKTLRIELAAQAAEYNRLKQAAAMQLKAQRISGGSMGSINLSRGFVFPVDGPHSFSDTFGAPRSGGRTHKGCDIFADFGTPVVAVVPGTVNTREGGLGGLAIWLDGTDGNSYYYAHLQGFVVTGGSVSAGQVIGRVGDTGNAQGGAPHCHFEIHPGGGGAIDPYPILAAAG